MKILRAGFLFLCLSAINSDYSLAQVQDSFPYVEQFTNDSFPYNESYDNRPLGARWTYSTGAGGFVCKARYTERIEGPNNRAWTYCYIKGESDPQFANTGWESEKYRGKVTKFLVVSDRGEIVKSVSPAKKYDIEMLGQKGFMPTAEGLCALNPNSRHNDIYTDQLNGGESIEGCKGVNWPNNLSAPLSNEEIARQLNIDSSDSNNSSDSGSNVPSGSITKSIAFYVEMMCGSDANVAYLREVKTNRGWKFYDVKDIQSADNAQRGHVAYWVGLINQKNKCWDKITSEGKWVSERYTLIKAEDKHGFWPWHSIWDSASTGFNPNPYINGKQKPQYWENYRGRSIDRKDY